MESISFEVGDGEVVGFVGLNGAGKTTTIRIAAGVSLPTAGSVYIDDHDVVLDKVESSKRVGWVPEIPNFEPNASAISLMRYFAGFYGIPDQDATGQSLSLLKSVGLEGSEEKKLRTYSLGMKKRFSLASAMLGNPKNFLFDEILNGLDPEGIHYFRSLIFSMKGEGKAVLLSSHILVEVESIADRVVIIHKGKVIKSVTRNELAAASGATVKIVIRNLDQSAVTFLKSKGEVRVEGNTAYVTSKDSNPTDLNSQLLRMGYQVSEISTQNQGLEEYFLKLVGGG